jgi:tetratricopeptide (TPR) repeat protein
MTETRDHGPPLCPILSTPARRTDRGREIPETAVPCRETGCALWRAEDRRCALVALPTLVDDAERVSGLSRETLTATGRILSSVGEALPGVMEDLREGLRKDGREHVEALRAWREAHQVETDDAVRALETLVGTLLGELATQRESARRQEAEVAVAEARVRVRRGLHDEALAAVRRAKEAIGATADLLNTEGVIHLRLGHAEEAESLLRAATESEPDFAPARVNLGLALRRLGRAGEAIEEIRAALRLRPTSGAAWNTLGNLHFESGRPAEALDAWRRAVDVDPTLEEAIENLRRQQVLEDHRRDALLGEPAARPEPKPAAKRGKKRRKTRS